MMVSSSRNGCCGRRRKGTQSDGMHHPLLLGDDPNLKANYASIQPADGESLDMMEGGGRSGLNGPSIASKVAQLAIISLLVCRGNAFQDSRYVHPTRSAVPIFDPQLRFTSAPDGTREGNKESESFRDEERDILSLPIQRRKPQERKKPENRRPKYFWLDASNLEKELRSFWNDDCGVELAKNEPPPIPNEILLMYYERHDLRGAIASNGGRLDVSEKLGGAAIMPGNWRDAVSESKELRQLVGSDKNLSADYPPTGTARESPRIRETSMRWSHHTGRKPKGYWSLRVVVQELYEYVDKYREEHGRPAVWMPRPSELSSNGRDDLTQAMNRFGGADRICEQAGMIPYKEWFYFEGQLELLLELQRYCDEYESSNYSQFPSVSDIRRNGYAHLHSLVQFYGGKKFLALRFGMISTPRSTETGYLEMNWGPFDLKFASELLSFIREDQLKKNPPLRRKAIGIPSESKLLANSSRGSWLVAKIQEFGGYENVARRLGLAF